MGDVAKIFVYCLSGLFLIFFGLLIMVLGHQRRSKFTVYVGFLICLLCAVGLPVVVTGIS